MRLNAAGTLALSLLLPALAAAEPDQAAQPAVREPVAAAVPAAPPPIPKHRFVLNDLTVFRLNPLGLESQLRAGYQRKLYDDERAALRDNFAFVGTYLRLNPAFIRAAAMIELQPLSMLNLRFTAEGMKFFSTFGFMQSFDSASAVYTDTQLRTGRDASEQYAGSGLHFSVEPLLQAKVGNVAIRNRAYLGYWRMTTQPATDVVFYDAMLDTLVPARGFILMNDLDVLYTGLPKWTFGTRFTSVVPFYGPEHVRADEDAAQIDNSHHRLGALLAYTFFDDGYSRYTKPTILVITSWYLKHNARTGQDVNRLMPYLVLGFAFQSDLLN